MRKLFIFGALVAVAACAYAQSRYLPFEVSVGTNATEAVELTRPVNGYIDAVLIDPPSEAAVTSAVSFVVMPSVSTNATSEVVYTNATHSAAVVARPRVMPTDNEGSDLTALTIREPILCTGDLVTFRVAQTTEVTNVTFRAWLRLK